VLVRSPVPVNEDSGDAGWDRSGREPGLAWMRASD
jgi:hypothetical protein